MAELDVAYGRLYPLETPRLVLKKIDGLDKLAQEELHRRIWEEVAKNAGQECVHEVCTAISETLRQHYDPSAEMPLHERMRIRHAEEAQRQRAAEEERNARVEQE